MEVLCLRPPTFLQQTGVIGGLHVHYVHVLAEELDDLVQLFVVAVTVHKYFKL